MTYKRRHSGITLHSEKIQFIRFSIYILKALFLVFCVVILIGLEVMLHLHVIVACWWPLTVPLVFELCNAELEESEKQTLFCNYSI